MIRFAVFAIASVALSTVSFAADSTTIMSPAARAITAKGRSPANEAWREIHKAAPPPENPTEENAGKMRTQPEPGSETAAP